MTPTMTTTTNGPQNQTGHSPCGCPEPVPSQPCCCHLVCFERPNYFCGHLLTDADLTLQQKYVIEKNKLYHRTMDGYGVVCGLKLICDCDCKGSILIHDGFAIDDCGNDLVICETTRFDVIGALKKKGLLVYDREDEHFERERYRSRCEVKQCFYITICYDETVSDYETPFQSNCTSGPKQCMPTRTHEGVRFDVTDKLPHVPSQCDGLLERIRECFELNCDSQLAAIIKQYRAELLYIFGEGKRNQGEPWLRPCELFCLLRAYFLNYLKANPDRFNCNLYDEIACLRCPGEEYEDGGRWHLQEGKKKRRKESLEEKIEEQIEKKLEEEIEEELLEFDRKELEAPFRKLLYYMQRYQYDCVLGDVVFDCQQPCEAHCLVLGTVEVLNGKLVRVCNTPRKYLIAPANLLHVLIYDIMTQELGAGKEDGKVRCCPDYDKFNPTFFLTEFGASQSGRFEAAASLIRALCGLPRSLHKAFDFTDSMAVSSTVLAAAGDEERKAVESLFGITNMEEKLPAEGFSALTPTQWVQSHALLRRHDSVLTYKTEEGRQKEVRPSFLEQLDPNRAFGRSLQKQAGPPHKDPEREIADLRSQVDELRAAIADLKKPSRKGNPKEE